MFIGKVIGKVVATIKHEKLSGGALTVLQRIDEKKQPSGPSLVAMDYIGCGDGDLVLVTEGCGARFACPLRSNGTAQDAPVDLAIVGILDKNPN
jgi:ethanolamine utilization protein EutN